jgi:hypothetical protein
MPSSPLVSPEHSDDGEESGALTSPKHLSQEPHYIHDETSDASANPDLKHIHCHGCVLEDDVSVIMDMEELIEEVIKNGHGSSSNVTIFSTNKKALQAWRHPGTNPSHDSKSVCTELTVDTIDSLD